VVASQGARLVTTFTRSGWRVPYEVEVFPLLVKQQSKDWPEPKQRTLQWFSAAEAAALVDNDQPHKLIQPSKRKASRH
jgi:hypothetical protein